MTECIIGYGKFVLSFVWRRHTIKPCIKLRQLINISIIVYTTFSFLRNLWLRFLSQFLLSTEFNPLCVWYFYRTKMPKLRLQHHSRHQSRGKGTYMRKCGSVCHSDDDSFDFLFEVAAGSKTHFKKLAAEAKQTLIDREYINKWTKYICNRCVEKGTQTGKLHDHAEQEAIESNQN